MCGEIAQMVERLLRGSEVPGSNPGLSDFFGAVFYHAAACHKNDRGIFNPDVRNDSADLL